MTQWYALRIYGSRRGLSLSNETRNRIANQLAKLERRARYESLERQGYKRPDAPVTISVHTIRPKRRDIDNTSIKAALDGIVSCGILEDDGPNQIKEIRFTQEKGETEKTIITIEGN